MKILNVVLEVGECEESSYFIPLKVNKNITEELNKIIQEDKKLEDG